MRCFIILEELGRETWTEFLRCRKVLPVVVVLEVAVAVEFVEADSGCFPFDFDEIEVIFGDVGGPFGYHANYEKPLKMKEDLNLPAIQTRAKLDEGYRCPAQMTEGLKSKDLQNWMLKGRPLPLHPPVLHADVVWRNHPSQKAVSIHKNEEFGVEL